MTNPDQRFDSWCLVELMGHRRIIARVSEQTIAGHGFLRLDEPAVQNIPARTQLVSPGSVYAMHPMTEDAALAYATKWRTPPVDEWDLPDERRTALRQHRAAITAPSTVDTTEARTRHHPEGWGDPDPDDLDDDPRDTGHGY